MKLFAFLVLVFGLALDATAQNCGGYSQSGCAGQSSGSGCAGGRLTGWRPLRNVVARSQQRAAMRATVNRRASYGCAGQQQQACAPTQQSCTPAVQQSCATFGAQVPVSFTASVPIVPLDCPKGETCPVIGDAAFIPLAKYSRL